MAIPSGDYRDPALREHFVYRAYDAAGRLLYVGCSKQPQKRWAEHRTNRADWVPLAARFRLSGPYNYDTARELERVALRDEYPLHAHTPQKQSAATRRNAWERRRVAELLPGGFDTATYLAVYEQVRKESASFDWRGMAELAIAKRRAA